jgi:hypothetical protein
MHINVQERIYDLTNSSGTCTPISTRSSSSYASNGSSSSTSSAPRRSSMKSSLKSTSPIGLPQNRKSSPPTVRFADTEPLPRPKPTPLQQQRSHDAERNGIPNPMLRYRHRPTTVASSAPSGLHNRSALPPRGVPSPQLGRPEVKKTRVAQRYSAPVQLSRPDPRWSGIPLPANFTPPSVVLEQRVTSFQSVASNLSVQSAPAVLQAPPDSSPRGPYHPLENYVPCLHASCNDHYSPTQGGPAYYLPQGPYSISKRHGYCLQHASQELKETNAQCKREWESLRQNAGRKTLGEVSNDFTFFLQCFRQDRKVANADLQRQQRRRVLGAARTHVAVQDKGKQKDVEWDWSYTPRHCTRSACHATPYSPFANHLYAFYHSLRPSKFTPLPTLCPPCAKNEVEAFERYTTEKWNSRCGWDATQWNEWFGQAVKDRNAECDFWLKAQERVVREKGPAKWVERELVLREVEEMSGVGKEEKKKGFLKKLFGAGG